MGCGTSSPAKYAAPDEAGAPLAKERGDAANASPTPASPAAAAAAATPEQEKKFDAHFSYAPPSADLAARVHDQLTESGYRCLLDRDESAAATTVRDSAACVAFLCADYFGSERCCLELCAAAEHNVPLVFVVVEGASWGGKRFPALEDVPETASLLGCAIGFPPGPCGAAVVHAFCHVHAGFHVTLIGTKEYYEDTPSVLRLMTGDEEVDGLWDHLTIAFTDIMRGKGEFINGSAAAVRKDHVLVGTTMGVAARVVPFDYLVVATGTRYRSDIKTEGASIAHRKKSFALERQRMKEVKSFALVGAGLVGTELAADLKSYFPEKEVRVYTKAGGWLPRVKGAHEMVNVETERLGIELVVGKEIVSTSEDGRLVTSDGEVIGDPGARTYWCTGYSANTDYLRDERTDADIRSELDKEGFIKVDRGHRMSGAKGLSHIFAGGDCTWAAAHTHGERTGNMAWLHAGVVVENILYAAGRPVRESNKPTQCSLNLYAGVDLAVSIGASCGFLYATDPNFESFFQDKEALTAKFGPIKDCTQTTGWAELTHGRMSDMGSINWLMFHMIPGGARNMMTKDDMTIWNMFVVPHMHDIPDKD